MAAIGFKRHTGAAVGIGHAKGHMARNNRLQSRHIDSVFLRVSATLERKLISTPWTTATAHCLCIHITLLQFFALGTPNACLILSYFEIWWPVSFPSVLEALDPGPDASPN